MPGHLDDADAALVDGLRRREDSAFEELLRRYHRAVERVARVFVKSEATAADVAQEAWMAVLAGVDGFQHKSTFRSWLFGVTSNLARKRAHAEARTVPMSALEEVDDEFAAVEPSRFLEQGHKWAGHWSAAPTPWADPERVLTSNETRRVIEEAVETLPPVQREVVTLRDLHQLDAADVCAMLEITEANQRVLLHRARSRLRRALDEHFTRSAGGQPT